MTSIRLRFLSLMTAAALLLPLAACGSSPAGSTEPAGSAESTQMVTAPASDVEATVSADDMVASAEAAIASAAEAAASTEEAARTTEDGFVWAQNADGTAAITGYVGDASSLVVPSEINGLTVTEIGENAFFTQSRMMDITLPDSIRTIGSGAFLNCVSLQSISLPDSVETLGDYVFARDEQLTSVTLGSGLQVIPSYTFYNCTALETINVPDNIRTLGESCLACCTALKRISLPAEMDSIERYAFYNCTALTELSLPVSTLVGSTMIGLNLTTLTLSEQLTTLEDGAFKGLNLESLALPAAVEHIGEEAFAESSVSVIEVDPENEYYCAVDGVLYTKDMQTLVRYPSGSMNETFTVPDGVTTLAPYAFERSFMLSEVTLPDSLTEIGCSAFRVSGILHIELPDGVTSLADGTFANCGALSQVTLPDGLTSIGSEAFLNCSCLTALQLPASLTDANGESFRGNGLTDFTVSADNTTFSTVDGILYDAAGETLIAYPAGRIFNGDGTVAVPEGTLCIGSYAFDTITGMSELQLPDTVTTLEDYAVFNCKSLRVALVPASVTALGEQAIGYEQPTTTLNNVQTDDFYLLGEENSAACSYAANANVGFFTARQSDETTVLTMSTGDCTTLPVEGAVYDLAVFCSSDENVAYTTEDGKVRAITPGTVSITLTSGTKTVFFKVTVEGEPVEDDHSSDTQALEAGYSFEASDYTALTRDTADDFFARYGEENADVSFDYLDNVNINCYTGEEYVPIFAVQGDEIYQAKIADTYLEDDTLFDVISDGMYEELSKFTCSENVVLYSGIPSAAALTGGNTVAEMKAAVGQIYESRPCISTSVSESVAHGYALQYAESGAAVMEIYAGAGDINGGYISAVSKFPSEYEYLLNQGARFLILDAGIREVELESFESGETETVRERYIKLLLLPSE